MPDPTPIATPSGYAPAYAVGFADPSDNLILVSEFNRLPVSLEGASPAPAPLTGSTASSALAGPFSAKAGKIVTVILSGDWEGSVSLQRSIDGGTTLTNLSVAGRPWAVFTASGCEQAWLETETGASYFLDIALTSGTLDYRVSQ